MTNEDRITVIEELGYTERQAAFLCLAALHGGYFLRRQYNAFLGLEPGGSAARLIDKATDKGHVRAHPSVNQTMIYHLGNRAFFEAIGEEDNRNRRWRQPYSVKVRLMGLDYVLAHRQHHYLATENEKLNYFCGTLGLKLDCLPAPIYRSQDGRSTTTRYFVDKFPLFLSGAPGAASPVVQFCYVDGNILKPSGFDTYLLQYRELWSQLTRFEVVFAASDPSMFVKAERMFARLCGGCHGKVGVPVDPELSRLVEHFRARDLFERRETASFDKRRLDQLRDELEEFGGPEYQVWYRRWKQEGDAAVLVGPKDREDGSTAFSTYQLKHDYDLFGDLVRAVPV
jgi:hypothetical protein